MPTTSILIINHNGKKYLKELIDSIYAQTYKDFEIILADTESTDDSLEFVSTNYPSVITLRVPNDGYGSSCNKAAKMAKGKYLAFLNEDMVLPPDFLEKILNFHTNKPVQYEGVTASYIVPMGTLPEKANTHPGKVDLFGFPADSDTPDSFVIPGSPFFIEKQIFEQTGGFNENIFLYGEDVDYAWRLKIFGYSIRLTTDTFLYHYGGASGVNVTPKGLIRILTSGFIPSFCNLGTFLFVLTMPFHILYITLCVLGTFILKGFKSEYLIHYRDFIVTTYRKLPQLIKMRKFVQQNRKLSDMQIVKSFVFVPAFIYNKIMAIKDGHRVI